MKETIYRCNRCNSLITGTVHRIGATDENGKQTKYGALFDGMDLCDSCMEEVTLTTIAEIENNTQRNRGERQQDESEPGQQDQKEETSESQNTEPATYKCSTVRKTCAYAEKLGAQYVCNYIGIEEKRRGCDPEACDKYKKAEHKRGRRPKKEENQDTKNPETEVTD